MGYFALYNRDSGQIVDWSLTEPSDYQHSAIELTYVDAPTPDPITEEWSKIEKRYVKKVRVPVISKLELLNRFTQEERVAVRTAAVNNPILADIMYLVEIAENIDLSLDQTIIGVNALAAYGIIQNHRVAEILFY